METSPPAGKTELLFFEPRPTQVQILSGSWMEVRPMQALTAGPLIFRIPASSEMVIDLTRTFLYLRCRILQANGATTVFQKPLQAEIDRLLKDMNDKEQIKNTATGTSTTAQTRQATTLSTYNDRSGELTTAQRADPQVEATIITAQAAFKTAQTAWLAADKAAKEALVEVGNANLIYAEAKNKHTYATAVKAGNYGDNIRVAPVANVLHSLFSSVDLTINGRSVTSSSGPYPYKAYLARLLSSSQAAINTQYESALFCPDTAGYFPPVDSNFVATGDQAITNTGCFSRFKATRGSQEFEVIDTLFLDLANQEKLLIPGLNLVLTLERSSPKFALVAVDTNFDFKIDITEAILYVRQAEVAPGFLLETERRLQSETAKYYFQRLEIATIPLNVNQTVVNEANLAVASPALPNRIIFGMVDTEAMGGSYAFNPFQFELFTLASINFFFNGQALPYRRPVMAASSNLWLQGFYSLFAQTGMQNHPLGSLYIDRDAWKDGYALQAFEFSPDGSVGEHLQLSRGGVLNLEMRFATPLPRSVTVVMLAIYDSYLQFTADRNVIANFTLT